MARVNMETQILNRKQVVPKPNNQTRSSNCGAPFSEQALAEPISTFPYEYDPYSLSQRGAQTRKQLLVV